MNFNGVASVTPFFHAGKDWLAILVNALNPSAVGI